MLVVLARDRIQTNSVSLCHQLPKEIMLYIISLIDFSNLESIGKNAQQQYYCAKFIFEHIAELNIVLQRDQSFQIREYQNKPLNSAERFAFIFFKPHFKLDKRLNLAAKEIKQISPERKLRND